MQTESQPALGQIRYNDNREIELWAGDKWIPASRYLNESMIVDDLIEMANALDNLNEPRTRLLRDLILNAYDQARLLFN